MGRRGFAFAELLIVLVILVTLVAVGMARITNIKQDAERVNEDAIVASVQLGITTYFVESVTTGRIPEYPDELDSAPNGSNASEANPFFVTVLDSPGVTNSQWSKINKQRYQGPTGNIYQYKKDKGEFLRM
jgi:type II secretory pathway pseudopilin PulG